jgi:hypothetical protein
MSRLNFDIYDEILKIQRDRLINEMQSKYKDDNIDDDEIVDIVDHIFDKNLNFIFNKDKIEISMEKTSNPKIMKLKDYMRMQLEESNLERYITIQNMHLLEYIAKKEKLDYKTLCKKYIHYEEKPKIHNFLKLNPVWQKVFKTPSQREYFQAFIEDGQGKDEYIKMLLQHIQTLYKDYPPIFNKDMKDCIKSPQDFDITYDLIFGQHSDGTGKWRSKKNKLKKKWLGNEDRTYTDYEMIMFDYIMKLEKTKCGYVL